MAGRRLDQVDAMRPVKQAGVVSTHSILYFAPAAASVGSGAALLLLHVSREGFFFISACMLTYAYADLRLSDGAGLLRYYRRRIAAVVIPYLCWTVIYFFYLLPTAHYPSVTSALAHLAWMAEIGYYQLYFLLVIMQFYLLFPLVLMLLRRTRGHHGLVIAAAAAAQVAISVATHWQLLPSVMDRYAQQDSLSYLLYLVGGSVVAFHLDQVHAWVSRHARLIIALTVASALAAEGIYFLAQAGITTVLGSGSDAFQPSVIPFNIGAITCGYLAGVALVQPWRSRWAKAAVRVGSDDAYGIYLSHMLFITALTWLGWGKLSSAVPWPLLCLATVGIVFACSITLTSLLARTPLAVPLTGRIQVPWPRRRADPRQAENQRRNTNVITEWIDAAAARQPDAAYLQEARGTGRLTYTDLQRSARTWALHLDRAGIPPGAHVAIRLPEPLGYAGALVAILGAGRVVVPLDPAAPPAALAGVLEVARPVAVIAQGSSGLPPGLPVLRPPGPGETRDSDEPDESASRRLSARPAGGIFLCTSGTTGTPKGVLLTGDQLGHVAACVAAHHRLTPADRGYCCLPLFHVNAEVVGLLATLAARACLVLDRAFSRRGFWPMIEEQRITWINAVPAIITLLAMEPPAPLPSSPARSGQIRFVRSASAPLPPAALRRFEQAFGIPVLETYGMTEAASMITANPLDGPRKPGSAGRPAGTEVRIAELAGEDDQPCPPGTVGRVQIRGPGVITGYATGGRAGAVGADGWLDTGDLGHLDGDGYLFLAGRSDDVINRGGEKIYPREIEDFLLAQPGVRSAAVVAARDDVLGQRPVAYVIPAGPGLPGRLEGELRAACEAALPRPKRPTTFHLVRELPLGPTGKVTRGRLRDLAAAG